MKHNFAAICKSLMVCLFIMVICLGSQHLSAQTSSQARESKQGEATGPLVCDQPVYDFGKHDSFSKVEHTFRLRNAADSPVTIDRVLTTCGCTAAKLDQKTLAPGESVSLNAEASLRGRKGPFEKHVYVLAKGDTQNKLRLTIKGEVVERVRIVPPTVNLTHAAMDTPTESTVTIESLEESAKFNVTDISTESPYLEVNLEPSEDEMKHELRVRTKPPLTEGTHPATLHVITDNEEFPRFDIPVGLLVLDKVKIVPGEVVVYDRGTGPQQTELRFLNVMPGSLAEFTVTGVEVPVESIQPEIIPRDRNGYLVKLMKVPVDRALEGKEVIILTDIPGRERIPVPIRIKEYPRPEADTGLSAATP